MKGRRDYMCTHTARTHHTTRRRYSTNGTQEILTAAVAVTMGFVATNQCSGLCWSWICRLRPTQAAIRPVSVSWWWFIPVGSAAVAVADVGTNCAMVWCCWGGPSDWLRRNWLCTVRYYTRLYICRLWPPPALDNFLFYAVQREGGGREVDAEEKIIRIRHRSRPECVPSFLSRLLVILRTVRGETHKKTTKKKDKTKMAARNASRTAERSTRNFKVSLF